jgi:hypothetical protein
MIIKEALSKKIESISDLSTYLSAIKAVCEAYTEQHPTPTPYFKSSFPFFNTKDTHRSHQSVEAILDLSVKENMAKSIDESVQILMDIYDETPSRGSFSDAVMLCQYNLLAQDETLSTAFKQQKRENEQLDEDARRPM